MRAVVYDQFGELPRVAEVEDPECPPDGVVIQVGATGLCRSDWHGWQGHDPGISLPHVPGHELAGTVVETGRDVADWQVGDRVTTPFVIACGICPSCLRGDHQVCDDQRQPGFTGWGSYADLVAIERADVNLVRLPADMTFEVAAGLGCRFATAYRAVTLVGRVQPGEWLVVHGCGGVGLAAVMIAVSRGAQVMAIDLSADSRALATSLGATVALDPGLDDVAAVIRSTTGGGADVSIDAIGLDTVVVQSLACLRPRGRHVQVGLLAGGGTMLADAMGSVIGAELQVLGSHGMAAHDYPQMLDEIAAGRLRPELLVNEVIDLDEAPHHLAHLSEPGSGAGGSTVIRP